MNRDLDLELLRLFELLLSERHLTRAARRAGVSQPAMSRALARMRSVFRDELFVRGPRGVVPTPRAEALGMEVRDVLERAEQLGRQEHFDPATLDRTFVLAANDFGEGVVLPRVVVRLGAVAPRVKLTTRPHLRDSSDALSSGAIDLVLAVATDLPRDAMSQHLFEDGFRCAVRKGHPRVGKRMTLDLYTELGHVLISPRGEPGGAVDSALEKIGRTRPVAVRIHSFLAAPQIVATSDLVLTGPTRILEPLAEAHGLKLLAPPIDLPRFSVHQAWHARVHRDPVHAWFRGVVASATRDAPGAQ
jgi:LysR family transcriptional regulator, transcriptional activator of nodD3 and syrA